LGISNTKNYTYATTPSGTVDAVTTATPIATLKGYAGRVYVGTGSDNTATTLAILCEGTVGAVPAVGGLTVCP
jgi:type IV pilus assembly protein PilA